MRTETIETPWSVLCRENPEMYERYVLAACAKSQVLWEKLSQVLCVRVSRFGARETNDFSTQPAYLLYKAIKALHGSEVSFAQSTLPGIAAILSTTAAVPAGVVVTEAKRKEVLELALDVLALPDDLSCTIVSDTWKDWLHNVQVASAFRDITRSGFTADLQEKVNALADLRAALDKADGMDDGKGLNTFDEWFEKVEKPVVRLPLGKNFANLNKLLGGGFGKGEHVLAVVPSGGGKTVLACQIAAEMAQACHHVMLISTEQQPSALLPRIFSCMSWEVAETPNGRLKHDQIKDTPMKHMLPMLNEEQQKVVRKIRDAVGPYIHMVKWDSEKASVGYIEQKLLEYNKQLAEAGEEKGIEMIILDWIGSTIKPRPGEELRHLMNRAAEEMFRLAEKHEVAALSTCQTNRQGRKVKLVDAEHIAEAGGMIQTATTAFGISTIDADEAAGEARDGKAKYAVRQYCNGFKARMSEAMVFEIIRNFAYMRYNKM